MRAKRGGRAARCVAAAIVAGAFSAGVAGCAVGGDRDIAAGREELSVIAGENATVEAEREEVFLSNPRCRLSVVWSIPPTAEQLAGVLEGLAPALGDTGLKDCAAANLRTPLTDITVSDSVVFADDLPWRDLADYIVAGEPSGVIANRSFDTGEASIAVEARVGQASSFGELLPLLTELTSTREAEALPLSTTWSIKGCGPVDFGSGAPVFGADLTEPDPEYGADPISCRGVSLTVDGALDGGSEALLMRIAQIESSVLGPLGSFTGDVVVISGQPFTVDLGVFVREWYGQEPSSREELAGTPAEAAAEQLSQAFSDSGIDSSLSVEAAGRELVESIP